MKVLTAALPLAAMLGLAACAGNNTRPTDVGNMQLPAPRTTGSFAEPARTTPDVGNMQLPTPSGGVVSTPTYSRTPTDTGNMALPSAAQGNSRP